MSTLNIISEEGLLNQVQQVLQSTSNANRSNPNVTNISRENAPNNHTSNPVVLEPPKANMGLLKLIQTLQVRMDEEGKQASKEQIKVHAEVKRLHQEAVQKAIEKANAEMEKAKNSGLFGKIFGWIAASAALVFGAALIATGGGAIAGGIMMALAVDQMVGLATGKSAMGELTQAVAKGLSELGMSELASQIVATVLVAALTIAVTMGAGAAASSSSASKAATNVTADAAELAATKAPAVLQNAASQASSNAAASASSASKVVANATADTSEMLASNLPGALQRTASQASTNTGSKLSRLAANHADTLRQVRNGSGFITGGSQVASSSASIDSGVHKLKADQAQVDSLRIQKFIAQEQAAIEKTIEELKRLVEHSEGVMSQIIENLNQTEQTNQKLIKDIA